MVNITMSHLDETPEQRIARFLKIGTIDLRVDYMGPAIGEFFDVRAEALRVGSRIGFTQMSLRGTQGELLSTASGAYIVS
jgi:acyl-coenzyme A thioesterase PaaI-like protein